MTNVGSIEAVLRLDSSGFDTGLSNATSALNKFANATKKLNGANSSQAMRALNDAVIQLESSLQTLDGVNRKNLSTFTRLATATNNMAKGLRILQSDTLNVDQATNTMNNIFKAFQGTLNGAEVKLKATSTTLKELSNTERSEVSTLNQLRTATDSSYMSRERLANATRQASVSERELSASSNQASSSLQRQSSASDRATASTNRQATATRGLGRALSSLRMMGTMVGSMLAYNFAHHLAQATNETIQSKSEMEGYFKMLHYGQGDIDKFNKALDETVQRFQRVNKYSLGETISSIGVEFDLTTDEMIKAMDVTSMITSEYLRAGRNANEASLAVKDVLQGQFQRLSRETGVKGEQLKEAGWNGDVTDVNSLLDALRKVGEDRNWDIFAEKANSLNDIVTILQNRFGEWSADMVNVVQPSIVGAFNSMMSFAQGLSQSLSGLWQWLNTDGFTQTAVKIGALATSVYSLTTAFAMYRTGASLVTLRNTSLLKTIYSLITGTKLEEMANLSVRDSIVAKLLGIKSEEVAEKGLVGAINANLVAQKLNTVANEESTVARGFNTASIQSQMMGLTAETDAEELNTLAKQLNVTATGEQTGATIGFTGALWGMITGEGLAEGATLSLTGAIGALTGAFLASPVGWFALAILGLASAFYVLSGGLDESWDKMKQFHDVMQDPHATINTYKDRVSDLTTKLEEAKTKYGEGSDEVEKLDGKLKTAKETLKEVQGVVEHGVYWNDQYNQSFEELGATMDSSLREVMKNHGYTKEQINKTGDLLDAMDLGTTKTYRALQVLHKQQSDAEGSLDDYANKLEKAGIKGDEASEKMSNFAGNLQNLQTHSAIANTSDDWWEWGWNSLYAGMDQFWIDWDKFWIDPQWGDAIDGLFHGLDMRFHFNDIFKELGFDLNGKSVGDIITGWANDIGNYFKDKSLMDLLGLDENKDYIGDFFKWLSDSFWNGVNSFIDGLSSGGSTGNGMKKINILGFFKAINLSGIVEWFDNTIKKPVMDWWSGFISFDWLPSVDFNFLTGLLGVGGYVGDITWLTEWLNTNLVTPLVNFALNPIGTLASWGLTLPQINLGTLIQGLFNIGGEGGFDVGAWLGSIFNIDNIVSTFTTNLGVIFTTASTIASNVSNVFSNLKSMIWNHIQGILSNVTTTFTNIKNTAVNQINGLRDGIQGGIDRVKDAFRVMKDSILNSAKLIYDGVKSKFDSVKKTIGDFWNNLTNPSSWGSAGSESYQRRSPKPQTARKMFAGSPVVRSAVHHGAGVNPYKDDSQSVKLKDLMGMIDGDNKVRLSDFLAMFSEGGFGAWDFHEPYKKKTFDTAKNYKTGSPSIKGIGTVGDGYQVGRFWDGKPKFSFEEFQAVAQAIFSAIPYKFYYDSEWKGNWVNALLSGAVNCSDGAEALIALARVFGFDGYKQHTTLKNGVGHFFAVIGGKAMDTTNFQNHGSWSPLGGAGIPTRSASYTGRTGETQGKTVNITNDFTGATIYGIDDLDSRIKESTKEAIREEFNDPFTVAI